MFFYSKNFTYFSLSSEKIIISINHYGRKFIMTFAKLDYQWFQTINHFASIYPFFNPLMAFFALKLDYIFYLGVMIYWFTRTEANRQMVFNTLLAASVALGTNGIIGAIYHRDRPFVAHHVIQLIPHEASASFPSNHAAASFAVATSIWLWRRKDGSIWITLAVAISFSRVWSGVHYPLDVVGGAVLGIVIAIIVSNIMRSWNWIKRLSQSLIHVYEKIEYTVWKA
jgi:undecaprenyl-diphosphatase